MRYVILPVLLLAALAAGADVGVDTILAPVGTMDSGELVIPRCIVANYDDSVANVLAHFEVLDAGGPIYRDSLTIPGLAGGARDTVAFTGWVVELRDSLMTKAWTTCAGDTNPANDTCRQKFFARVRDYAIIELLPRSDTLDSGLPILFKARVWNFGNTLDSGYARFRVGSVFVSTSETLYPIPELIAARDSWDPESGGCGVRCSLFVLPGDTCVDWIVDTFLVRGRIGHDVGVLAILAPGAFIDTATTVIPSGRVNNLTSNPETFWAFFNVNTLGGAPVYAESVQVLVGGLDSLVVDFPSTKFPDTGLYVMACSTAMPDDQNSTNDVVNQLLRVVADLTGDFGIKSIIQMPRDTVDTLTTFHPLVRMKNYGTEPDSAFTVLVFSDTARDRVVYRDSVFFRLSAGEECTCSYDSVRFTVLGDHEGQLWVGTFHGEADTIEWQFWVVPSLGVEESGQPTAYSLQPTATIIRGVLVLPRDKTEIRPGISDRVPRSMLLDVAGCRVLALHAGANDVSGLAPGVYFVREPSAVSGQPSAVRKVILQR